MKGFVYIKQILSTDELRNLLDELSNKQSYYFVRSPHKVSGISLKKPAEFPGFEGQIFNSAWEVRWKKQGKGYKVLLLSKVEANQNLGLEQISRNGEKVEWEVCDRSAHWYRTSKTRPPAQFPNEFLFIGDNGENIKPEDIPIAQRYFKDKDTATVHFVALTIQEK